jgi:general secretion pathway protein D
VVPGQPVPPQATVTTPPPPAAQPGIPPGQPRTAASFGGSSFFFDDADVFEVIQTVFGEVLRVNYIIDPAVKGRVNFRTVTPIPRDRILPVMEIILRLNGIAVIEEAGLYRIIQIANVSKEPAQIRFGKKPESVELRGISLMQIVPLTYIPSTEMAAILTPMLTQGGAVHDISKKNMLIIADTDANVRRLLEVIAIFDDDTKRLANQPKIYVYPVQNGKSKNVSEILHHVLLGGGAPTASASTSSSVKTTTGTTTTTTSGTPATPAPAAPRPGATGSAGGAGGGDSLISPSSKIFADEASNALIILATPGDYSVILAALKQIDVIPRQVMLEAIVASVTLTDNLTFGLKWNANINANISSISPLSAQPQMLLSTLGFQNIGSADVGTFGYTIRDKAGNIKLAIQALAANDKAKVLSAPQLLVADNKEAKIQVGQQIPLATSTTSYPGVITTGTTSGISTTSTIQYTDVGTILTVKPQINDGGLVSLEISQEVSSATTQSVLGTDQYVITKNQVKTNLIVQDGETILIGGMVSENVTDNKDGIPILSKIPILSWFAGSVANNKTRQEIVVLITPRVIRNPADAEKVTSQYSERFKNVEKEINYDIYNKRDRARKEKEKSPGSKNDGQAPSLDVPKKDSFKPDAKPVKPDANAAAPVPSPAPAAAPTPTPAATPPTADPTSLPAPAPKGDR